MADKGSSTSTPAASPNAAATPVRMPTPVPLVIGGVMVGLLALVFALPSFVIIGAGMIPTVVARVLPVAPEQKRDAIAVAMLNCAGVLPVLAMLWSRGHTVNNALQLLGEPLPWILMLGSAALAVILQSVLPNVATTVMERAAEQRVRKLMGQQEKLIEEWGAAVKGDVETGDSLPQPAAHAKKKAG